MGFFDDLFENKNDIFNDNEDIYVEEDTAINDEDDDDEDCVHCNADSCDGCSLYTGEDEDENNIWSSDIGRKIWSTDKVWSSDEVWSTK